MCSQLPVLAVKKGHGMFKLVLLNHAQESAQAPGICLVSQPWLPFLLAPPANQTAPFLARPNLMIHKGLRCKTSIQNLSNKNALSFQIILPILCPQQNREDLKDGRPYLLGGFFDPVTDIAQLYRSVYKEDPTNRNARPYHIQGI